MQPFYNENSIIIEGELLVKKIFSILLTIVLGLTFVACGDSNTSSNGDTKNKSEFMQEVTIIKMPSPPKCKTSNSSSVVNEVLMLLREIEKAPSTCGNTNGWQYMINIKIDGQELSYSIASDTFTDSDGQQYSITNYNYINEKISSIYEKIDTPEKDYT